MDQGFPAHLFRIGGSPEAIQAGSVRYQRFGEAASRAADRISGMETSQFIGPEGDQFRQKLNSDLPPHLHVTGQAFTQVAKALMDFASRLADLQAQMRPLAEQAPGAWQRLQAAKATACTLQLEADQAHDAVQQGAATSGASHPSPPTAMPNPASQSAASNAQAKFNSAREEWDALVHKATMLRAEMTTASNQCGQAIEAAKAMRFQNPPDTFDLLGQARDFIREHQDTLGSVAHALKGASAMVAVLGLALQEIPPFSGGAGLLTTGVAMGVDHENLISHLVDSALTIVPVGLLGAGGSRSTPPARTPTQNAKWWSSLSPTAQQALLRDHPEWIGNMDGIPAATRSAANMARIPVERARLQRQLEELNTQSDGPMAGDEDMQVTVDQMRNIQRKLRSLDTIQTTMAQGDRQLLFLDTTKPRVEAAVAVGNVDTAHNVAVFTPGFTTTVDGALPSYDSNMHDLKTESDRLAKVHGGGSTATVTWIGYQAPQVDGGLADPSHSVASPTAAKTGGAHLAQFYNGIGASHEESNTPLHLTALGHSYGSTTTGFALGHNTPVNDAILFGSPGQGVQHLHVPAGDLYDEHNAGDNLVPDLHQTLGPSPYYSSEAIPEYHQLSTGPSASEFGHLNATQGHSGYLDHKSTSLYNMAAITSGHPDLAMDFHPPSNSNPPGVHAVPVDAPPAPPGAPPPPTTASPPGQDPSPPPEPR